MHEFVLLYALHDGNSYPAGFWFMFFLSQVREGCFWWGLMLWDYASWGQLQYACSCTVY